jgi:DNA-binding CsgD family transcriptional regulator
LVGRDRERAVLRQALAAALAGQGSLVLIGGEAGIGKTALAETVCREAADEGAIVLVGRCYDLTETPPYGPWVELFATCTPANGLPAHPAAFSQRGTVGAVESLAALYSAVQDFFTALAAYQPLVLLLEDLHWADPASLDLLRFLARTATRLPLLLLVTYRADELTRRHPLYTLLPLLERESGAIRLDLHRLSTQATQTLVAARVSLPEADLTRLVRYLHGRTDGNAFFTLQLLRALSESGAIRAEGDGWIVGDLTRIHVPLALRQVIDARLARLPEETQHLLAVAAVIGQDVPLALWATVTERDEDDLLEVIEHATDARILEATEDGTQVRFVHALIREAVYEGIPSVRRRRLHARVGEALLATAAPDPDAVVFHLRRAGDGRLVAWLLTAAERARYACATTSAIAHYEEALPLLPASAPSPERFAVLWQLASMLLFLPDSLAYAEDALHTAQQLGDPLLEGVALTRLGTNRTYFESIPEGLIEQERAVTILSALPENETHWFMAYFARTFGARTSVQERITVARAFLAMTHAMVGRYADLDANTDFGRFHNDYGRFHNGLYGLLIREAALGRPQEARALGQRLAAQARADGDDANLGTALYFDLRYVVIPYYADNAAEVRRIADAGVTAWAAVGEAVLGVPPRRLALEALFLHGEWEEAWSLFRGMRRFPRTTRSESRGAPVRLLLARGESDLAWTLVREMFPAGTATEPGTLPYRGSLALQETAASMLMDAGDLPGARAWLAMHDRWLAWSGAILGQSEGQALWAAYYRQAGDAIRAHDYAERARAHASEPHQPLALLAAHRLLGELDTDAGLFATAAQHLDAALALADACEAPYERALVVLADAELHGAMGDTATAHAELGEVTAICTRLGAKPALARADALAARLSVIPAPAYPAGLSAREVEVLALVAHGLTNPQVAERLFLSPRTIDQHLRSIYNKLGVSTRAAATHFAVAHGLA